MAYETLDERYTSGEQSGRVESLSIELKRVLDSGPREDTPLLSSSSKNSKTEVRFKLTSSERCVVPLLN